MSISLIVGTTSTGIIASEGKIPWKCSADMKHFKETTTDNIVVMGRKTWDSMGNRCLPNRFNIVVSRNRDAVRRPIKSTGFFSIVDSIEKAVLNGSKFHELKKNNIFIIGGEEIYRQCLRKKIIDKIYLSIIDGNLVNSSCINEIQNFNFG